jgi:3-oxoacyl-[acyl-carrier protein] reductase
MHSAPVALVTGSARGIGRAIGEALLSAQFSVVFNGVSQPELESDLARSLDAICEAQKEAVSYRYKQADIANPIQRNQLLDFVKKEYKRIDILVNNAGVGPEERKDLLEASEASFEKVIKINLQGPYFLTQSIARWMIELTSQIENYHPIIINISSISAFTSSPNRGEYCVSKAGLSMATKLFADRLAPHRIQVFEIQPGIIETDMTNVVKEKYDTLFAQGLAPINHWGQPEDVAQAVIGIVKGHFPYSTGEVIHVDGGFHLRRL